MSYKLKELGRTDKKVFINSLIIMLRGGPLNP